MTKWLRAIALIAVLAVVAAACGGGDTEEGDDGGETPTGEVQAGGTLRLAFDGGSDFFYGMNPTAEYYSVSWEFLRCCMARTLLSYEAVTAEEGGNDLQPDLAAELPEISDDGLTYTFTLKDGIMFGDPVNREITADDFVTAFNRIADPEASEGGYWFYYHGLVEGFAEAYDDEKVDEVSGVKAVDDKTLEVTLEQDVGAFPYLVAMAATAPLPQELVDAHPKDLGTFLVSSGPYQWEGMEGIDLSGDEPPSGMNIGRSYVFVRNPSYDPATDGLRPAYPDRIEVQVGGEVQDLLDKVDAGVIDMCVTCLGTAATLQKYHADPALEERIKIFPNDGITYTGLNVFQAPFDDVHVRKAVNWAVDRAALLRLIGGEDQGTIASHFIPPAMMSGIGSDYDPYGTPDQRGDIEAAKAEMQQSKYDTDGDGICDAPECSFIALTTTGDDDAIKTLETMATSFSEIGLEMDIQTLTYSAVVKRCSTMSAHQAFCQAAWGKDFASAFTYFDPLLDGGENGSNYAFLGTTEEALQEAGYEVPAEGIPSIAEDIDECWALPVGEEANTCWHELDRKVMEEIVPVIVRRFSNNIDILGERVANYSFSQFSGQGAIDHLALVNGGAE
jgi:peptide/nickel transport system substrate-binding protein